jgi:GDP-4-dehydro-6-deoxy-D-mannose reductase
MKVLITGVNGFIGSHLVEHLHTHSEYQLIGVTRSLATVPYVTTHAAELTDANAMNTLLATVRPDWVFHLAGYANTGKSFDEPLPCWQTNLDGTRILYDAIIQANLRPRILFVSTGLIYGDPIGDMLCDETSELRPASPYAASKAAADLLSYQYTRRPNLDIVRVRLFNQIGPRQSPDYAIANFARQIAAVEAGRQAFIETGNLSAQRDLTDVRDIVVAFRQLMEHGQTGEAYNAGRGQTWTIQDVLDRLVRLAKVPIDVRQKPNTTRHADTAVTRVNALKLMQRTGWRPTRTLDETLVDTLNYWRSIT